MDETVEESDEEINVLKRKIRLRRRQKQEERRKGTWNRDLLSDGRTDSRFWLLLLVTFLW